MLIDASDRFEQACSHAGLFVIGQRYDDRTDERFTWVGANAIERFFDDRGLYSMTCTNTETRTLHIFVSIPGTAYQVAERCRSYVPGLREEASWVGLKYLYWLLQEKEGSRIEDDSPLRAEVVDISQVRRSTLPAPIWPSQA